MQLFDWAMGRGGQARGDQMLIKEIREEQHFSSSGE